VSPQLIRLQSFRSVYSIISSFIKDPHLRQVFSFHPLLVGGNPFTSSSIYTLIHYLERNWGVFFVKGGTGALVQALVRLFEELGGEVRLSSEVERIHTSGGRVTGVTTKDGWHGSFDAVASNADVVHTYASLLEGDPHAELAAARLTKKRFSMSLFVVYFGSRRRHTRIAHHDILFGPRYRELLDDIFESVDTLADDFSLYLHAPTLTDPSVAPDGCEAFYVLSPVPHLGNAPLDWSTEGPRYRDRILEYLEKRYLPGLGADIETVRILTPHDFKHEMNSHLGSAFSLEPILTQSAWFRVHNRDRSIGGLYFAGAGTHPGAGVPGVVNSAKATAGLMIPDLLGKRT
jgi:phytoene desaturase